MAAKEFELDCDVVQVNRDGHVLTINMTFARASDAKREFIALNEALEAGGDIHITMHSMGATTKQ